MQNSRQKRLYLCVFPVRTIMIKEQLCMKNLKYLERRPNGILQTIIAFAIIWALFPSQVQAGQPCLQKPQSYSRSRDVTGWVMSEKLDGIRGYWNGRQLVTRKGVVLHPPAWFIKNFPSFELDGELWSGRGEYEYIQSVVLDRHPGKGWEKITYNIFEVPNQKGDFFQRLEKASRWFAAHPDPFVHIIHQTLIGDLPDLDEFIKQVASRSGEGVIVKDPQKAYHTGRSPYVLKIKETRDMEGEVIAINPGKGKFAGVMGSLTIRLENGIQFKLGTGFTEQNRQNPPPVGTQVTFKYYGFTKNKIPKFPSFLRIRSD